MSASDVRYTPTIFFATEDPINEATLSAANGYATLPGESIEDNPFVSIVGVENLTIENPGQIVALNQDRVNLTAVTVDPDDPWVADQDIKMLMSQVGGLLDDMMHTGQVFVGAEAVVGPVGEVTHDPLLVGRIETRRSTAEALKRDLERAIEKIPVFTTVESVTVEDGVKVARLTGDGGSLANMGKILRRVGGKNAARKYDLSYGATKGGELPEGVRETLTARRGPSASGF